MWGQRHPVGQPLPDGIIEKKNKWIQSLGSSNNKINQLGLSGDYLKQALGKLTFLIDVQAQDQGKDITDFLRFRKPNSSAAIAVSLQVKLTFPPPLKVPDHLYLISGDPGPFAIATVSTSDN